MDFTDMPPLEGEGGGVGDEDNQKNDSGNKAVISDSDSEDNDENLYDDEEDGANEAEATKCLFCDQVTASIEAAIAHIEQAHKVSFSKLKTKFVMDQYSFLKLINYIRCEQISAEQLLKTEVVCWNDEKYLKPKYCDAWLTYDYEELLPADAQNKADYTNYMHQQQIQTLQQSLQAEKEAREIAEEALKRLRVNCARWLEDAKTTDDDSKTPRSVGAASLQADAGYFSSYAHFGIHQEMLADVVRTTSYRDALLKNREFVWGKDVLDVGCGTSILSIFAAQAGAKTVVGIDNSDIIYNAMDIVKKNNIENVALVKGRLEDTALPQQQYDIIISEWMGYFLLFEGMLDTVIYARDRHLKAGGMLLPNRCTMSLLGYGSDALYSRHIGFWDDVYGLDMSNMRKEVLHEPLIEQLDPQHILTAPNIVADLDLLTVDLNYSNFTHNFQLKCTKDGKLSALVGYFDTYFDLPQTPIAFGTAPTDAPTHWKQVVFFLERPQAVRAEEVVSGKLVCSRSRCSARSLDITIEVFGRKLTYYLD